MSREIPSTTTYTPAHAPAEIYKILDKTESANLAGSPLELRTAPAHKTGTLRLVGDSYASPFSSNVAGYPVPYGKVALSEATAYTFLPSLETTPFTGVFRSAPGSEVGTVTFADYFRDTTIEVREGAILHIKKLVVVPASVEAELAEAAPINVAFEAGEYNVSLSTTAKIHVLHGGTVELARTDFPNLHCDNGATVIDSRAGLEPESVPAEAGDLSATLSALGLDLGDAVARPEGGAALEAPASEGSVPVTGAEAVAAPAE